MRKARLATGVVTLARPLFAGAEGSRVRDAADPLLASAAADGLDSGSASVRPLATAWLTRNR